MANNEEHFPTEYDGIVIGTGMTESIIAAALARIGHRVLHIDREDHYSADWSTFNFQGLQEWIQKNKGDKSLSRPDDKKIHSLLEDGETTISLEVQENTFTNIEETVYIREKIEETQGELSTSTDPLDVRVSIGALSENKETLQTAEEEEEVHTENKAENLSDADDMLEVEDVTKDEEATNNPTPETQEHDQATVKETSEPEKKWVFEEIKKEWRRFNLDLSPKVLHCSGDMVKLLITSDVAKYCEFKTVTRVLTKLQDKIIQVPCSRADVFDSKQVSMIEKRMMMKFLQFCAEFDKYPEKYQDYQDKPFSEFLKTQKLSAKIQHYVEHAIAMATKKTSTLQALASVQKFIHSLGKYGNTAFLWPMYGSGELPQCFCRMCAVFGGTYYLQKAPAQLILGKDNEYKGIIDTDGLKLKSKWLIMNTSYASEPILPKSIANNKYLLSRAILLADHSLLKDWAEHITLLHLPASDINPEPVTVFELSHVSQACPKNLYVIQMTTPSRSSAKEDLVTVVESLFQFPQNGASCPSDDERPCVLWSLYFNTTDSTGLDLNTDTPDNVFLVGGASPHIGCDHCVLEAKSIFEKICPGEEFLPKAPNPEDIIYHDETVDVQKNEGAKQHTEGDSKEDSQVEDDAHSEITEEQACASNYQTDSIHKDNDHRQIGDTSSQITGASVQSIKADSDNNKL